jgi:hypothetical protein
MPHCVRPTTESDKLLLNDTLSTASSVKMMVSDEIVYLFICGLFNDALSNTIDGATVKWY